MRLLIVRHGDPDYELDSLTEKGFREVELLSERLVKEKMDQIYVSTMGRAMKTAEPTLKKTGKTAVECEWLREFSPKIMRPDVQDHEMIVWDWLPKDWLADPDYADPEKWCETEIMKAGHVKEEYQRVIAHFDQVLAEHGYVRDGKLYRVENANEDTLVFFCHFGLQCVLLSHLMNISPMILWHFACAAPSSVTTVYTEERREGTAIFRVNSMGDQSHLYAGLEKPSFAARFCETYHSEGQRRD